MADRDCKVLWVEDEAQGALAPLGEWLKRSGIDFDLATSFDAAERRLSSGTYSALLLDILIPHSGKQPSLSPNLGLQLARLLREGHYQRPNTLVGTPSNIAIVALTIVRLDEIKDDIEELGITYFDKTMLLERDYMTKLIATLRGLGS